MTQTLSDAEWLRVRNLRTKSARAGGANSSKPCVYRGVRYPSLTAAARATGEKLHVVAELAKRIESGRTDGGDPYLRGIQARELGLSESANTYQDDERRKLWAMGFAEEVTP